MKAVHGAAMVLVLIMALRAACAGVENPFEAKVLDVRPRVFLRNEPFDGLTIEKLRARVNQSSEFAGVLLSTDGVGETCRVSSCNAGIGGAADSGDTAVDTGTSS